MPLSEVGPYHLVRLLKSGGEGSVYVAEDRRLGRRVAVKLLPLTSDVRQRRKLLASARRVAALSHPSIVQLYDVVELPDSLALVMEYVDGNDLEKLLHVAELDVAAVLQLGQDVCTALAAAHAEGIVHGDLKPGNILIKHDGTLKLADFGQGVSASVAAPEQRSGGPPGPAADMYALGCLLYRLLTGVHPTDAPHVGEAGTRLSPAERGMALPEALDELIMDLLSEDPSQRPAEALDVRQRLLSTAREHPASRVGTVAAASRLAATESASTVQGTAMPRRFGAGWLSVPILGAVVALGGMLFWRGWPPDTQAVLIERPAVTGDPAVSSQALEAMLREAVQAFPGTRVGGDTGAESLRLEVECNAYLCSSQLVRGDERQRADTRALLPGASGRIWRLRLEQGVRELYSR